MARAHVFASLLGLGLMLVASSTDARELEFFVENSLGGDSNVFRRSEESTGNLRPKAGGVWEISPRITLRDRRDELEYDFRYQPTYERFFAVEDGGDEGDFSGFDHTASAMYLWRVSPSTSIGANGRFSRQRRIRGVLRPRLGSGPDLEQTDDEYVQRGTGSVTVSHALATTFLEGSYAFDDLDTSPQANRYPRPDVLDRPLFHGRCSHSIRCLWLLSAESDQGVCRSGWRCVDRAARRPDPGAARVPLRNRHLRRLLLDFPAGRRTVSRCRQGPSFRTETKTPLETSPSAVTTRSSPRSTRRRNGATARSKPGIPAPREVGAELPPPLRFSTKSRWHCVGIRAVTGSCASAAPTPTARALLRMPSSDGTLAATLRRQRTRSIALLRISPFSRAFATTARGWTNTRPSFP